MPLNKPALKVLIESELLAKGFDPTNEHARLSDLAEAIANAVVDHITTSGVTVITSGSSAGSWPIQ